MTTTAVPNPALVPPAPPRLQQPKQRPSPPPELQLQRQRTVVKRKAPAALKALAGSIGGLTEALFLQPVVRIIGLKSSGGDWFGDGRAGVCVCV